MGRSLSNNFGFNYTNETSLGVAGTSWKQLEPNALNAFGATITTVARNPLSRNRQALKGVVTDLDSSVAFTTDATRDSIRDFAEALIFATGINTDVTDLTSTAVSATTDGYTVAALSAAQADKFEIDTLVYASGHNTSANNGLKVVDADIAASATEITVAEALENETPPSSARISFAGYQISAATVVTWTWNAGTKQATLNATGKGTVLQALGLTVGQVVHIGSQDSSGASQRAFENAAANDMFGHCRVVSMDADNVIFDKVDAALQFTDATDPATAVDILFGEFFRNVTTDSAEFLERSVQFEGEFIGLDTGDADMYSYAKGNFLNTATFDLPLTNKAEVTYEFIGTDTDNPVSAGSRKSGASSAVSPTTTTAFNTSSDIARLRITEVDEDGITTDFKNISFSITNNVTPEKVLNTLGAKFMNSGNFGVSFTSQLVFTNSLVVNKIRSNETVTMDFIMKNDNGTIAIDIPSMTLGDGALNLPENESILISLSGTAFRDPTLNTSIGISVSPTPLV